MVQQPTAVVDGNLSDGRKAPAFTPQEHDAIAEWAENETIKACGLRVEIFSGLYQFLEEALLVFPGSMSEPSWLIHKTPKGAVAVREWPGLADIVPTVPDALGIIASAVGRRRRPEIYSPENIFTRN